MTFRSAIKALPVLGSVAKLLGRSRRALRTALLPRWSVRQMHGGYSIKIAPRADQYQRHMYDVGTYEPATLALFDAILRPGDIVVDVGANLGLMTIHAATRVGSSGRVIAVEAHPGYFERLTDNIARNRLNNVRAVNNAAGSREEHRSIFDVPSVNIGRSSLVDPGTQGQLGGTTHVRRLDDILADQGVTGARLWKMDVEGFEAEVINGAPELLKAAPIICMEVVYDQPIEGGGDPLAAHDLIMQSGLYDVYRFGDSKFTASPLVAVGSRAELATLRDNLIYLPKGMRAELPGTLFA